MQEIKLVMQLDDIAAEDSYEHDYVLAKLLLHYKGRQEEVYAKYLEAGSTEDDFFDHLVEQTRNLTRGLFPLYSS